MFRVVTCSIVTRLLEGAPLTIGIDTNLKNHLGRNCPDHWRQFHRTTGSTYIPYDNTPADRTKASCYNCAGKGHWGHECTVARPTPLLGPILEPFTTGRVYDSQSDLLNQDDKIRREKRNKKRFLITIG